MGCDQRKLDPPVPILKKAAPDGLTARRQVNRGEAFQKREQFLKGGIALPCGRHRSLRLFRPFRASTFTLAFVPRALPWAVMFRPFGAGIRRSPTRRRLKTCG